MIELLFKAIWLFLPAYFANAIPPMISKLKIQKYNKSVDKTLMIKNRELFGKNKTLFGIFFGILGGTLLGTLQSLVPLEIIGFPEVKMTIILALFLSSGALLGDLGGSFIKRRLKIENGNSLPLLDQLDFLIGAIIFAIIITPLSLSVILIAFLITPIFHIISNIFAYKLKIKKVPW